MSALSKPALLKPIIEEDDFETKRNQRSLQKQLEQWQAQFEDPELALRRFHRSEMMRIAWRDLCNVADIQTITEELAELAEVVLHNAYDLFFHRWVEQYGQPLGPEQNPALMVVIGMGKLGGRELNFSSDVDLMFVYDGDGKTSGGSQGSVENKMFFTSLAQAYCDFLSKATAEGFLYRVDTRLRPEGNSGELASSLMTVEVYYHTYGQNWERQALLKARPVAGDAEVGQRFMSLITPFTYRKYVDEIEVGQVLRDVDAMREKMMEELSSPEARYTNFKNGLGGIRDIEFFVQAVQMLYGGQYPEIKLAGTLVSLRRMYESHLLYSNDYKTLSSAYRFLRRIEHRLQMVGEQQIYELPVDPRERSRLASSLDYDNYETFHHDYQETTQRVRELYSGVFHRKEWEDSSEHLAESTQFDDTIRLTLEHHEFDDPRQAFNFLKALQKATDAHLQPKHDRLFKAALPRLLQTLKQSPDPDLALANLEKLVSSFRARTALYETLSQQTGFLDLLVSVISGSAFLTQLVLRDPSLMETLADRTTFGQQVSHENLNEHLVNIQAAYPNEALREQLLRVQNAAMFRSGVRFIIGNTSVQEIGQELAAVADFVLQRVSHPVHAELEQRYPQFAQKHGHKIATLGFGKLGGRDFNVASDCDIVFVYLDIADDDCELTAPEFFVKWTTRYIGQLESRSRLGFLYEPDTRLRPHGKNSPLACSWNFFASYYQKEAQLWERMALSRARWITGEPSVEEKLDALKQDVLFSRPLSAQEIEEILSMRRRIEKEKGEETLKAGPGGLIDVEFIAQALVLHEGHRIPALRSTSTLEILHQANQHDVINEKDYQALNESYLFLREVENRLRIVNNVSLDSIPQDAESLEALTRRYGLGHNRENPSPEQFLSWIEKHTNRVRDCFHRFFDSLQ